MDPRALTVAFNEHINNRDPDGLATLMTTDHTFIDSANHAIHGKSDCLEAWRGFFKSFPDYRNAFDRLVVEDNRVIVVGRSSCSDVRLDGPALWVATVRDNALAEWRVYEDTPANRRTLGIAYSEPRSAIRLRTSFAALVAVQAAHSIEEYVGRLYETFPPARFVSGAISSNLEHGFVVGNVFLVAFGLWCWLWPVRRDWPWGTGVIWFWVVIELVNGIGHPLWSLQQGGYTPGVATAPLLFALSLVVARQITTRLQ